MRLLSAKNRMALRGRLGLLTYLIVGTAGILIVYYAWNSLFAAAAVPSYKVKENKREKDISRNPDPKWSVLEEPPNAVKQELQKERALNRWKQEKALQDRLDEERLLQEQAAQQKEREKQQEKAQDQNFSPGLFQHPDPADEAFFHQLQRLVHLDLKGAPPLVSYLEQLFPLLKSLGATGLLIEYEDMFPYSDSLSLLAAGNAYSQTDLQRIQMAARQNDLEIVPLVQTFGHMEFVLKYEKYMSLREQNFTPQVITPTREESYLLLQQMIKQILKAHPEAKRIHLGCDEVYDLGEGQSHTLLIRENLTPGDLFLRHVTRLAKFIRSTYPHIKPLIWDDWIRNIDEKTIESSELNKVVEPVVWFYEHNIMDRIEQRVWEKYGQLFEGVWVASAFKGATGSGQYITNSSFHIDNNLQWVAVIRNLGIQQKLVNFRGIALTGWQRYDHFATLCELLPVGLPSLAMCLSATQNGGFSKQQQVTASRVLRCSSPLDLELPALHGEGAHVTQDCSFPGSDVFYAVQQLWGIVTATEHNNHLQSPISGWLTNYQVQRGFSSPWHLRNMHKELAKVIERLQPLLRVLEENLLKVYDRSTVDEWLETNVQDRIDKLEDILGKAEALMKKTTWPRRPLGPPPMKSRSDEVGQKLQSKDFNPATQGVEMVPIQGQVDSIQNVPVHLRANIPGNGNIPVINSQVQGVNGVITHGSEGYWQGVKLSDVLRQSFTPTVPSKLRYIQNGNAEDGNIQQQFIADPNQKSGSAFADVKHGLGQNDYIQNFQQPQQVVGSQYKGQSASSRWNNAVPQNGDNRFPFQQQVQTRQGKEEIIPNRVDDMTGRANRGRSKEDGVREQKVKAKWQRGEKDLEGTRSKAFSLDRSQQ
ncbi:hypothetical protein C0Q70_08664 [Pomacea canaliculata]|uniref:beta-N-acetylhexosaminidase n=2 Tax=Pomacea canaliculata TaxID=400727 RepID=A0A2T7P7N9_POMCA|nr:hexosaminidase D-like isoform X2 [Pomacea canaliculata]PVD29413.1 hypothetical protein C0Q70_08664 [Pomacea canaliculata]